MEIFLRASKLRLVKTEVMSAHSVKDHRGKWESRKPVEPACKGVTKHINASEFYTARVGRFVSLLVNFHISDLVYWLSGSVPGVGGFETEF